MNYKSQFLLDPEIHFLNHGSYGACPRPVFKEYQKWQRELEVQPVEFFGKKIIPLMAKSRSRLAQFINCDPDEVVYFTNPTTAINMLARSLDLNPGDEILSTNHEYGAMNRTWNFIAQKTNAHYINAPINTPVSSPEELVENFWKNVSKKTKAVFISHIASQTALKFPVEQICKRARERGIISIVDGAHTPGQLPIDMKAIGADFYTGACHKWLCAPKGAAFLYARADTQHILEPLIVSWGYLAENPSPSRYIDHHEWQGTRDMAAFLAVPSAIEFQEKNNWPLIQEQCHALLSSIRKQILDLVATPPLCPDSNQWYQQMAAIQLPEMDTDQLQEQLYSEYKIEIPVYRWLDKPFLRISIQAYNNEEDTQALLQALTDLVPKMNRNV